MRDRGGRCMPAALNRLVHAADFRQRRFKKMLMSKTGIHRHCQYLVHVLRARWHPNLACTLLNLLSLRVCGRTW